MVAEIGDLAEDTGKGAEGTVPGRIHRDRTTQAAQYAVVKKAVMLVGDSTGITPEVELREGVMVTTPTPPPHQDGQRMRGIGHNCTDGGRLAYREQFDWGVKKCHHALTVRTCH